MRSFGIALALTAAIGLGGCLPMPRELAVEPDEPLYGRLFPYYAELCAVSQIKKKPEFPPKIRGGPGGHAVMYLNGVCRDRSAGYPTLTMCDSPGPTDGVGLSINAHYVNAVWTATDGRDFFFDGDLARDEPLTLAGYRRAQAKAKTLGVLDGVAFHQSFFKDMPPGTEPRDHMYELSIGTDYAIGFARHRYCARVPLERAEMVRVVAHLNAMNQPYKAGEKVFEWDVFGQNCVHVLHDALATAGVWERRDVPDFWVTAAVVFPVPKNEFVKLMERTNDLPLEDPAALYEDEQVRDALMRDGRLPTRPGALASARPVTAPNEVYDIDLSLIFYDRPFPFDRFPHRFDRIFREQRYSNLRANLAYFAQRYRALSAGGPAAGPAEPGFTAFRERLQQSIAHEASALQARLGALAGPATAAAESAPPAQD